MKKILYIHHGSSWGGASNSLIKLIDSLDCTEYDTEVLLLKYSIVAEKLSENGIKFSIADSVFYRKYYQYFTHSEADYLKWYQIYSLFKLGIFWLLSRFYFAKKELAKHDFDIVHLNSSVLTDWLSAAKEKGKVIIHLREPFRKGKFDLLNYLFKNQILKYADHIIAISNDNAERINIPSKTTVVYNYASIKNLNKLGIEKYNTKTVLYVGGSEGFKGFYVLADALKYLNDDVLVYFSGYFSRILNDDNPHLIVKLKKILKRVLYKNESISFAKVKNSKKALYIGLISNIDEYLDRSVCLVSPFIIPHFSRPIIEAFARRKPAIATDIDGMNEEVKDGYNGILVPAGNAKALASAINYLCENPEVAKNMGDNGYEVAKNVFSPKNINQICEIYYNLLK